MTYVDWQSILDESFREGFLHALRKLPFERSRNQPPPRTRSLPFGFEFGILGRYLRGQSCHFHPSGFSKLYRAALTARERDAYLALVLGQPFSSRSWIDLIGRDEFQRWIEKGILVERSPEGVSCCLRVISIASLTLVVDPMDVRFANRVHVGSDSLDMVEFLLPRPLPRSGRYLDVGTGSGVILLAIGGTHSYEETLGVDINPRAVALARFNAELNADTSSAFAEVDIFSSTTNLGLFDLVTWNTPFRFLPESHKKHNLDGYGGHMGIEIGLKFVETLPTLLTESGEAYIQMLGPVLKNGRRVLDEELEKRAASHGLDVTMWVLHAAWDTQLRGFHEEFGITRFEESVVRFTPGKGMLERRERAMHARILDGARWLTHEARKAGLLNVPRRPPNVCVANYCSGRHRELE